MKSETKPEVKIKICGITRPEDASLASELGAWAIGFVFHPGSPRAISPLAARVIRDGVSQTVKAFGVFVDCPMNELVSAVRESGIDAVQLHGTESPSYCEELRRLIPGIKVVKALRLQGRKNLSLVSQYSDCDAVLFDAYVAGKVGGTGRSFDWSLADQLRQMSLSRVILAGGLRAVNAAEAIRRFSPFALDVSSGVEIRPGIKDHAAMREFFGAVRTGL